MNTETTTGAKLDGIELRGIVQCDSQRELLKADLDDFVDAFIDFIEGRKQTYGGGFQLVDCSVVPEEKQDRITQALVDALRDADTLICNVSVVTEHQHREKYRVHMNARDALALVERTKEGGGK